MGETAELMPNMLQRVQHTPPQASLDWRDRQKNVKHAFGLNQKQSNIITGKNVVLIDDVITTGATIRSCVKALKQAKPDNVYVLTLARRMPID
jgi:predicted amidophosphoribosyltransferase